MKKTFAVIGIALELLMGVAAFAQNTGDKKKKQECGWVTDCNSAGQCFLVWVDCK